MTDKIREQIEWLRGFQSIRRSDEVADTMERLLAVVEAARGLGLIGTFVDSSYYLETAECWDAVDKLNEALAELDKDND